MTCLADEFGIGGEGTGYKFGDEYSGKEGACGNDGSGIDGEAHHPADTVELTGTVVVSGNGLHTLVQAHHYHYKEEYHAVGYAVCPDGKVTSVVLKTLVDNDYHKAGAQVHQEG